jgi:hypothetical protein
MLYHTFANKDYRSILPGLKGTVVWLLEIGDAEASVE